MGPHKESDDVAEAARALSEALVALTKVARQGITEASEELTSQLSNTLQETSRVLADASLATKTDLVTKADRRKAKAERTKRLILDASRTVIAECGFEGASVGDIAEAAGFTKGAIYANFGGKEELLFELAKNLRDEYEDSFDPNMAQALEPSLLLTEITLYAIRHPHARATLCPLIAACQQAVARRLAETSQADATQVADTAFGLWAVQHCAQLLGPGLDDDQAWATGRRLSAQMLSGLNGPDSQDCSDNQGNSD